MLNDPGLEGAAADSSINIAAAASEVFLAAMHTNSES